MRETSVRFRNREEAGALLAERLEAYRTDRPVVLGIPRGGVPMASLIATRLEADLDVILVHKLRAPSQPELAFGSIDEAGRVYLAPFGRELTIGQRQLDAEIREQRAALTRRRERYTAARPPLDLAGRTVILVDDGLATGATAIAAVRAARAEHAAKVIVAVGVAPPETIARLRMEADDVVCLYAPSLFGAVGEFFEDFSEVSDDDVVAILEGARSPLKAGPVPAP